MDFLDISSYELGRNLVQIMAAFLITLPVAWDREKESRSMGLRTFPLVAVASCGFIVLGAEVFGWEAEPQARLIAGLMTGIGFIGGGAILKGDGTVHGTATAAAIWGTGVIGAACAYSRYEIAIIVSLISFILLRYLKPVKRRMEDGFQQDGDADS